MDMHSRTKRLFDNCRKLQVLLRIDSNMTEIELRRLRIVNFLFAFD